MFLAGGKFIAMEENVHFCFYLPCNAVTTNRLLSG
uniref:Uncharacterized protein n=1 Tax=Anguilla anguilla TaxID=7936 RepID=A0A0E9TH46_ANGAN